MTVPEAVTQQVSCSPRKLGFWKDQYAGKKPKFTSTELGQLAAQAAALSGDYFGGASAVVAALGADGTAEQKTARQYAALLLNLAAGDLSPAACRTRPGFPAANGSTARPTT